MDAFTETHKILSSLSQHSKTTGNYFVKQPVTSSDGFVYEGVLSHADPKSASLEHPPVRDHLATIRNNQIFF